MKLFPVFHLPCLFVFSVVCFWRGYLIGIFHFLISNCNDYLQFYAVRYPYHLSLNML